MFFPVHYVMNGIQYLVRSLSEDSNKKETFKKSPNRKATSNDKTDKRSETENKIKKPSFISSIFTGLSNLYHHVNQQVHQSIGKIEKITLIYCTIQMKPKKLLLKDNLKNQYELTLFNFQRILKQCTYQSSLGFGKSLCPLKSLLVPTCRFENRLML